MEPELVTVEACNRFFIVEQRWGNLKRHMTRDGIKVSTDRSCAVNPSKSADSPVPVGYIFQVMSGPYARVYKEWVDTDNRRIQRGQEAGMFSFIIEARTKKQVVDWLVDHNIITQFNGWWKIPDHLLYRPHTDEEPGVVAFPGPVTVSRATLYSTGGGGGSATYSGLTVPVSGSTGIDRTNCNDRCYGESCVHIATSKENNMSKQSRLTALQKAMIRISEEMSAIEALPDEPTAVCHAADAEGKTQGFNANVVFFEKTFYPGGQIYTYSAVRADNGLWYTTGPRGGGVGRTWDSLVEWITEGNDRPTIYAARKFKALS